MENRDCNTCKWKFLRKCYGYFKQDGCGEFREIEGKDKKAMSEVFKILKPFIQYDKTKTID